MTVYNVTYREHEDMSEVERNTIASAHTEGVDLADVIETCKTCDCNADLFNAAGFRKGWVHADGSYTLT